MDSRSSTQNPPLSDAAPPFRHFWTLLHRSGGRSIDPRLPFGSHVKVTNLANGRWVLVRINDRGPFVKGRVIDFSKSAFRSIGNPATGVMTASGMA